MITGRLLKAALRNNVDVSALTWNGKVTRPKPAKKKRLKSLLPPPPKTRRPHLVDKKFAWEDLEKVLRGNSAHGFQRVEHERVIHPVSGLDMRRRIHALGFSVTQFARRHGMNAAVWYEMTHYPAGALLTRYIRLVEYEETLAAVADILEATDLTADDIRARLDTMLTEAASRL